MRLASLTSAPLTPNQLTGFLSLYGITLPRPLSQMTIADLHALLLNAGVYMTEGELTQALTESGFDLSQFASSCNGVVSRSTPCG